MRWFFLKIHRNSTLSIQLQIRNPKSNDKSVGSYRIRWNPTGYHSDWISSDWCLELDCLTWIFEDMIHVFHIKNISLLASWNQNITTIKVSLVDCRIDQVHKFWIKHQAVVPKKEDNYDDFDYFYLSFRRFCFYILFLTMVYYNFQVQPKNNLVDFHQIMKEPWLLLMMSFEFWSKIWMIQFVFCSFDRKKAIPNFEDVKQIVHYFLL